MGLALTADQFIVDPGPGSLKGISLRQRCEMLRAQAELERSTFISHWRDLNDYILPRRGRFALTDVNRGDRRTRNIFDSTATKAARTLQAGMMSGITSPSRPWFRLSTDDQDLNEQENVKEWLYEVNRRMELAFARSNLYNALPLYYGDMGVFGTASMAMMEDDETIFRFYVFPVGSYALVNDQKQRPRTFVRTFRMQVGAIVEKWGAINPNTGKPAWKEGRPCQLSNVVTNLWDRGQYASWIDLVYVVMPNYAYDGEKISAKYKRFKSVYYELGSPNQSTAAQESMGVIEESGFDEFPILTGRWETNAEDVFGTNCPGMVALGDIKELQTRTKRIAQAVEKMINPPMTGPSSLRSAKASVLPGDITYYDANAAHNSFRPAHEINFGAAFGPLEQGSQAIRDRIDKGFYADLFLMLENIDRANITATEISERKEEKLLALGPMLEQLNQDLLDPLIDRAFNVMFRKGLIPPPPQELQGTALKVEYVSIMAQAQRQAGLQALERFAGFIGQAAQYDPSIVDLIDGDEIARDYADRIGVIPTALRSTDAVQALRTQRQQQQQQQQAAENAPGIAGAVHDLSQSPTSGDNALARLVGRSTASRTLQSTSQPPAALAG